MSVVWSGAWVALNAGTQIVILDTLQATRV